MQYSFAPVDRTTAENVSVLLELADSLELPSCFLTERVQSVTRAFSFEGDQTAEFRTWFHFLCKAITTHHETPLWLRAGFYLRRTSNNETSLVCFGASENLRQRITALLGWAWKEVDAEPLCLLSLILADPQAILDEQVWAVNDSVGSFEYVRQSP